MAQLVDLNGLNKVYKTNKAQTENLKTGLTDGSIIVKNSEYATKIGSKDSHSQVGNYNVPVYINSEGQLTPIVGSDSKGVTGRNNLILGKDAELPDATSESGQVSIGNKSVADAYFGWDSNESDVKTTVHALGYKIGNNASLVYDATVGTGGAIVFKFDEIN